MKIFHACHFSYATKFKVILHLASGSLSHHLVRRTTYLPSRSDKHKHIRILPGSEISSRSQKALCTHFSSSCSPFKDEWSLPDNWAAGIPIIWEARNISENSQKPLRRGSLSASVSFWCGPGFLLEWLEAGFETQSFIQNREWSGKFWLVDGRENFDFP